ncbi:MAG: 3',5'-cyclic AMP phosphodiesterase CpdA [Glaciecola sp.]|jgi:3',5'-cyclic AMP phosphodiesterase CpdA|uniref:metallophosphoesterase family protein n=1 Tax=Congregibacter sp. TaxID=2744308 RepID=UPI0039E4F265
MNQLFMALSLTSKLILVVTGAVFLASCTSLANPDLDPQIVQIVHKVPDGPKPWTDAAPNYDPDAVRFAIFSDLTGGEREGVFELAVEQLNLLRPELVVNVGDLIEGSTERAEIDRQWTSFDQRAQKSVAPLFYTGGNHDLLNQQLRTAWKDRLGPRYYHLRYRNVLFLVLDTEDHSPERLGEIATLRQQAIAVAKESGWDEFAKTAYANLPEDETGMISQAQASYMRSAIADNSDVRWTFLLMHKAPWTNNDMPTWQAIEDALGEQAFTVFHGHRHSYRHTVRNGRDYIRLATTGGVFLPDSGSSMDHLVWVTVDKSGAYIANLKMSGILDKSGKRPLNGEDLCLNPEDCPSQ